MKVEELLKYGKIELEKNKIEDASIIAKILIQYVLKIDKNKIIIEKEKEVEKIKEEEYKKYIKEIVQGKPIQYIINNQEFMKLNFFVNENVLIPQPDTEILVEKVLEIVKENMESKILDICTGSGAIGISLAYYLNKAKLTLADISSKALEISKINAKRNNVEEKIKFINSDMFEKIEEKYNIIVSNPPYIKTNIIPTLDKQVQNEPYIALDGGKDGLKFYRILIDEAPKHLEKDGILIFEIGYDQKEDIENLVKENKNYKSMQVMKDLSQNDRVVILKY